MVFHQQRETAGQGKSRERTSGYGETKAKRLGAEAENGKNQRTGMKHKLEYIGVFSKLWWINICHFVYDQILKWHNFC